MYDSAPNTSKTSEETRRAKQTNESSTRNGNETIIVYDDDDDTPRDEELGRKWGEWDTPTDGWEAIDVFEFVS